MVNWKHLQFDYLRSIFCIFQDPLCILFEFWVFQLWNNIDEQLPSHHWLLFRDKTEKKNKSNLIKLTKYNCVHIYNGLQSFVYLHLTLHMHRTQVRILFSYHSYHYLPSNNHHLPNHCHIGNNEEKIQTLKKSNATRFVNLCSIRINSSRDIFCHPNIHSYLPDKLNNTCKDTKKINFIVAKIWNEIYITKKGWKKYLKNIYQMN